MKENKIVDKKFYIVGIVLGICSIVSSLLIPDIGLILGIVSLVLNLKNKKEYGVKIGIVLSVAGIIVSLFFVIFIVWTSNIM